VEAGPVADQPDRPRTPPGVGTPLRAVGPPDQRHPPKIYFKSPAEGGKTGSGG